MILLSIIVVLLLVDLIVFINDRYILSFFGLVAITAGAWYFVPELANLLVAYDWLTLLGYYVGAGVLTAAAKWFIANISLWLKLRNAREDFQRLNPPKDGETQADRQGRFARYWNLEHGIRGASLTPFIDFNGAETFEEKPEFLVEALTLRAKNHVDRITCWVLQWPIVIVATAFEDLLINIGRNVARFFDYAFTQFSRRLVASTVKDL